MIAPSGAGKTPACYLEPKIDKSILMDDASSNGLFNHFASGDTVPILCVDEAHSFLTKISSLWKSPQANLTMERLCKCFNDDCWYMLKGNKGKRTGIPSARASLLAFTTPKQFQETVWPKILSVENGFAERVLLCYQKEEKDLEAMAQRCEARGILQPSFWMSSLSRSIPNIRGILQLITPLLPVARRYFSSFPSHKTICLALMGLAWKLKPATIPSGISMFHAIH